MGGSRTNAAAWALVSTSFFAGGCLLPVGANCGDGRVDRGEQCDDGNMSCRDGCRPDCTLEPDDLAIVDLNLEAQGDLNGHFWYVGPSASLRQDAPRCRDWTWGGRTLRYTPETDGLLLADRVYVAEGPMLESCSYHAHAALQARAGVPIHLRYEGDGPVSLDAFFLPRRSTGESCDPRVLADTCDEPSMCVQEASPAMGRCESGVDLGCGTNVPSVALGASDARGVIVLEGSIVNGAQTIETCVASSVPHRIHHVPVRERARVRAAVEVLGGGALTGFAALVGGCRAAQVERSACVRAHGASALLDRELGVIDAGTDLFLVVYGPSPTRYALTIDIDPMPDLDEACDPSSAGATCPEGAPCASSDGAPHTCTEGADVGCGAGMAVVELEPWRDGGVIEIDLDPMLANVEHEPLCGLRRTHLTRDFVLHLRMPFTANVELDAPWDANVSSYADVCGLGSPRCERSLGEVSEASDLWIRADATMPFTMRALLERMLEEGAACDPDRFTDRCPLGTACAPDGAAEWACIAGGDLGCGPNVRIDPLATLRDGSGLFVGSTSAAIGHRERQVCDRRLGATLELVHRWVAPDDGTLVVATSLRDTVISARLDPCSPDAALACANGSLRLEGVRAGTPLYLVLDAVPDGADYDLRARIEGARCGSERCDAGLECRALPTATRACMTEAPVPTCGNGALEPGETCDDGNALSGDGCEPDCTLGPFEC